MDARVNARTRYRLHLAASSTRVDDDRQAVIVGAILLSTLKLRRVNHYYVARLVNRELVNARATFGDSRRFPTAPVSDVEIDVMKERFIRCHKEATP